MRDTVPLYVLQYQLKRNLRPFTREEIQQLPTGRSGVYVLWRKTGTEGRNECLYVGESTTCVRRRLLQHDSNAQNDGLHSQLRATPTIEVSQYCFLFSLPYSIILFVNKRLSLIGLTHDALL